MGDVADVQTITSLSVVVPPSNYVIVNRKQQFEPWVIRSDGQDYKVKCGMEQQQFGYRDSQSFRTFP